MRRLLPALTALLACGALSAGAVAATSSEPGTSTELAHNFFFPEYQLGSDALGRATAVWEQEAIVGGLTDSAVFSRAQDASGRWGSARQLGSPEADLTPALAVAPDGAAVLVLSYQATEAEDPPHGATVLEAFTRPSAGAPWSSAIPLATTAGVYGANTAVAIDSAGVATVAWADLDDARSGISTAAVDATHGTASAPVPVPGSSGRGVQQLQIAEGNGAETLLSWRAITPASYGEGTHIRAGEMVSAQPAGGHWSPPRVLDRFRYQGAIGAEVWAPESPTLAVAPDGNGEVIWVAGEGGNSGAPLESSTFHLSTMTWSAPHQLAADPNGYGVAASADRGFLAVWSTGPRATLMSAFTNRSLAWQPGGKVGTYSHSSDLEDYLSSDPAGDVTLSLTGPGKTIVTLTHSARTGWGAPTTHAHGVNPEVSTGASGQATLLWERVGRHGDRLEAGTVH